MVPIKCQSTKKKKISANKMQPLLNAGPNKWWALFINQETGTNNHVWYHKTTPTWQTKLEKEHYTFSCCHSWAYLGEVLQVQNPTPMNLLLLKKPKL